MDDVETMDDSSRKSGLVSGEAELDANIVKHILEVCSKGATIFKLPAGKDISSHTLKEYLFYLITCDIISYHGKKKEYTLNYEGWKLLSMINIQKNAIDEGNRYIEIYH